MLKLEAFRSQRTMRVNREQAIALGALAVVLFICIFAVGFSLAQRSGAAEELAMRQQLLDRLQAQARRPADARGRPIAGKAPAAAFLDAPTPGLAGAQLQSYMARLAKEQHAALLSSGAEPAGRDDAADSIRIQATLELDAKSLQEMLYRLETATPYIFVETLSVQSSTEGTRAAADPILRVTLGVRALWRQAKT